MIKDLVIIILEVGEKKGKNNIAILRDSMIKHLKGYEMPKKIGECKVFVKVLEGLTLGVWKTIWKR